MLLTGYYSSIMGILIHTFVQEKKYMLVLFVVKVRKNIKEIITFSPKNW